MNDISPEERIVEILKTHGIDLAATLPCDRMKCLLPLIETNFRTVQMTREENGVGICAGHYLGGGRPVMVIQSTGLGNMFNALLSLNSTYGIPLPIIASWRGVYKEGIPAQLPLGIGLPGMLEAADIEYTIIDTPFRLGLLDAAIIDAFENRRPHVALIQPSVWEMSSCALPPSPKTIVSRTCQLELNTHTQAPTISRYQAIRSLAAVLDDEIVVSNIGVPSKELYNIMDRDLNFYMLGSMGLASAIGLGLTMAQHRHVVVIDGDGSLLMNPNALTQIAVQSPPNLTVVAVNNGAYGSTGNQETAACTSTDLELMARGHGMQYSAKAHTGDELVAVFHQLKEAPGPAFIDMVVMPINEAVGDIPLTPVEIKDRFIGAIKD
ncbi:MAG: sulfopyruvate decarboxylase subunit beta [Methanosarcinales archaeon]|nr:sulfopyruvate decarboxylase subunit beta [Methanosarcinales archaeon]